MGSSSPPPTPPNAAREIFEMLLASAIGRCRASGKLCRLSISLKCFHDSDPPSIKIFMSDTGVGSSLEEFQRLDEHHRRLTPAAAAAKWDGVLFVTTTCIGDKEVYRYQLDLREAATAAARLTRLPSAVKNGKKFSGTEVVLSLEVEGVGEFANWVSGLIREVAILRIPTIAFLIETEHISNQGTKVESIPLENYVLQPLPSSNIERLAFGLEDYVHRHGNALDKRCQSCFPIGENLMVGKGIAGGARNGHMVEAVIIIAEVSDPSKSSCSYGSIMKNEVLYFHNHLPCAILESPRHALESMDWHSYGLSLEQDLVDGDGHIVLKHENLPPSMKIVIAIHCYQKKYPLIMVMIAEAYQKIPTGKGLVKKAIKIGFDDLKTKHKGLFISPRALKIQKHVPDLSRAIAGLILSSNDTDFQHECASLLGLHPFDIGIEGKVESCIREKVTEIIEMNDKKKNIKKSAPSLFECEGAMEENYDDGSEAEEVELSVMDL